MKVFFSFLAAHVYCLLHWKWQVFHIKVDGKIIAIGAMNGKDKVYWMIPNALH